MMPSCVNFGWRLLAGRAVGKPRPFRGLPAEQGSGPRKAPSDKHGQPLKRAPHGAILSRCARQNPEQPRTGPDLSRAHQGEVRATLSSGGANVALSVGGLSSKRAVIDAAVTCPGFSPPCPPQERPGHPLTSL
jgi:hypothetical protein